MNSQQIYECELIVQAAGYFIRPLSLNSEESCFVLEEGEKRLKGMYNSREETFAFFFRLRPDLTPDFLRPLAVDGQGQLIHQ